MGRGRRVSRYISFRAADEDVAWLEKHKTGWTRLMKAAIALARQHPDEYRRILKEKAP